MMRAGWVVAVLLCASAAWAQAGKFASPCESGSQKLSPTGKHAAIYCKDHSVRVVDLPGGREVVRVAGWRAAANVPPRRRMSASAFSADGTMFGLGMEDGTVQVWSLDKPSAPKTWKAAASSVDALTFLPKSKMVALAIHLAPGVVWDFTAAPVKKASLETDFDSLTAIAASPDGKWVVTTGADTAVRVYDAATWKKTAEYREMKLEPFAAAFTPDGKYAVIGGADRQLTLLDPASGKAVKTLAAENDPIGEIVPVDADRMAVVYFDADGRKPPHLMAWNVVEGSGKPVDGGDGVTGGGVAKGKVWFIRANAKDVEVVEGK